MKGISVETTELMFGNHLYFDFLVLKIEITLDKTFFSGIM